MARRSSRFDFAGSGYRPDRVSRCQSDGQQDVTYMIAAIARGGWF